MFSTSKEKASRKIKNIIAKAIIKRYFGKLRISTEMKSEEANIEKLKISRKPAKPINAWNKDGGKVKDSPHHTLRGKISNIIDMEQLVSEEPIDDDAELFISSESSVKGEEEVLQPLREQPPAELKMEAKGTMEGQIRDKKEEKEEMGKKKSKSVQFKEEKGLNLREQTENIVKEKKNELTGDEKIRDGIQRYIEQINQEKNQKNFENLQEKEASNFLRFGDLIIFHIRHKIYDRKQRGQVFVQNLQETPNKIYKGILSMDEITSSGLYTTPTNSSISGRPNFREAIFRIETPRINKFKLEKERFQGELQELSQLEEDSLTDKQLKKLNSCKQRLVKLNKIVKEEEMTNENEFKMSIGNKVTYGQAIQFRHILSNKFLSLDPLALSSGEHGCQQIRLSHGTGHHNEQVHLLPPYSSRSPGDAISYSDNFCIKFWKKKGLYVHMSDRLHVNKHTDRYSGGGGIDEQLSMLEVNASIRTTKWQCYPFLPYTHIDENKNYLLSGDLVRLFHKEGDAYLRTTQQSLNDVLSPQSSLLDINIPHNIEESKIVVGGGNRNMNILNACWEIQNLIYHKGGKIEWNKEYRLKHISSGRYLTVNNEDHSLDLTKQITDPNNMFVFIRDHNDRDSDPKYLTEKSKIILHHVKYGKVMPSKQSYRQHSSEFYKGYLKNGISVFCSFQKGTFENSIYIANKVPVDTESTCRHAAIAFSLYINFYNFLESWKPAESKSPEKIDSPGKMEKSEHEETADLREEAEYLSRVNARIIREIRDKRGSEEKEIVQNIYVEKQMIDVIVHLLQLIELKTVPRSQLQALKRRGTVLRTVDRDIRGPKYSQSEGENTIHKLLHPLSEGCLKLIWQLIRDNQSTNKIIGKYDTFFSGQILHHERAVGNILRETFKNSSDIFGGDSDDRGHNIDTLSRWAELLAPIQDYYGFNNIKDQILYINIIAMLCRDHKENGVLVYQIQCLDEISKQKNNILQFKFGLDGNKRPFVIFPTLEKQYQVFLDKNAKLAGCTQEYKGQTVVFLEELSKMGNLDYVEYIAAVINLYSCMCLDRYQGALRKIKEETNFNFEHIIATLQEPNIHNTLKESYILALKVFYVDAEPYHAITSDRNRCLYWMDIKREFSAIVDSVEMYYNSESHVHLEQAKTEINDISTIISSPILVKRKERIITFLTNYFTEHNYCYSRIEREDDASYYQRLNSELYILFNTLKLWKTVIKFGQGTHRFVNLSLKLVAVILTNERLSSQIEKQFWILGIMRKAKSNKRCKRIAEKIQTEAIDFLRIMIRHRQNFQVYLTLQMFYEYHVIKDAANLRLNQIFEIYSFNLIPEGDQFSASEVIDSYLRNQGKVVQEQGLVFPLDLILSRLLSYESPIAQRGKQDIIKVLSDNFRQKETLFIEMSKIELIVSADDEQLYSVYKTEFQTLLQLKNELIRTEISTETLDVQPMDRLREILIHMNIDLTLGRNTNLTKSQNFLRHIGIYKVIMYILIMLSKRKIDRQVFKLILDYLYKFVYRNKLNQESLFHHVTFLLKLNKKGFKISQLIGEILEAKKDKKYVYSLVEYIAHKIFIKGSRYNVDYLALIVSILKNGQNMRKMQVHGLKHILKHSSFQKIILMDNKGREMKAKLFEDLEGQNKKQQEKANSKLQCHLLLIDLFGAAAHDSLLGIKMCRKLIYLDDVLQALNCNSSPYIFKRIYLHFLYEVYLSPVEGLEPIDPSTLYELFNSVIYEDLKRYVLYYSGLIRIVRIEKYQRDIIQDKQEIRLELFEESQKQKPRYLKIQTTDMIGEEEEFYRSGIIQVKPLQKLSKIRQFYKKKNSELAPTEYWDYMSCQRIWDKERDGLLHFLLEYFTLIKQQNLLIQLNKDFITLITKKIPQILTMMLRDLQLTFDNHKETFQNDIHLEDLIFILEETLESIPFVEAHVIGNQEIITADNRGVKRLMEIEDQSPNVYTSIHSKRTIEEDNNSHQQIVKDIKMHIMDNNLTLTQVFHLFDRNEDRVISKYEFIRTLRELLGKHYSRYDIEAAFFQMELGRKNDFIDFEEWANTLVNLLDDKGFDFDININPDSTSKTYKLKMFMEIYLEKITVKSDAETGMMAELMQKIINLEIAPALESGELEKIDARLESLLKSFENSGANIIYFLDMCLLLLKHYTPDKHFYNDWNIEERAVNTAELVLLQNALINTKIAEKVIELIATDSNLNIKGKCIKILCALHMYENTYVQNSILSHLKGSKYSVQFLHILVKIIRWGGDLIATQSKNSRDFKKHITFNAESKQKLLLLKKTDISLEERLNNLKLVDKNEILFDTLKVLQHFCDNCHSDFQNYLRKQNLEDDSTAITSVNVIYEVGRLLISLSEQGNIIFEASNLPLLLPQIFDTLTDFVLGPCIENQFLFGTWQRMLNSINFFIRRRLKWNSRNKDYQFKNKIYCKTIAFLRALLSNKTMLTVGNAMMADLDIEMLKLRMIQIYKEKIMFRRKIYRSNKICKHMQLLQKEGTVACDKYICTFGFLSNYDVRIIDGGFNTFMFLTQLRGQFGKEEALCDFRLTDKIDIAAMRKLRTTLKIKSKEKNENLMDKTQQADSDSDEEVSVFNENLTAADNENSPEADVAFREPTFWEKYFPCCLKKKKEEQFDHVKVVDEKPDELNMSEEMKFNPGDPTYQKEGKSVQLAAHVMVEDKPQELTNKIEKLYPNYFKAALEFFAKNSTSVEINNEGKLERIFFHIPSHCRYLTKQSRDNVLLTGGKDSQQEKLEDFFENMDLYRTEMRHQQHLARTNGVIISALTKYNIFFLLKNNCFL